MTLGLNDLSATQEKIIQSYIQDNIPSETILMDQLKRNDNVEVFNQNFYAPVRSGRNGGITNLATDKSKVVTSNSTRTLANVSVKILTGTFDLTDLVKKATANKKLAVANEMTQQGIDMKTDFARNANRQYFSDGYGVAAEVAGSTGAGTLSLRLVGTTVDDARTLDNYGTVNGDILPADPFAVDMIIGIGSTPALGTITSVSGNTLVVTGAPAITAGSAVYIMDGSGLGAGTSEIQGLKAALSSSTGTTQYAGVARSVSVWTPQLDSTSEALSLNRMQLIYLQARKYARNTDRYAWFMNLSLFNKYGNILTAMRRTVNEATLLGGWSGLEFQVGANGKGGKVGVFLDYQCPDGAAFLVNLDTWTVCQVADMAFVDGSGEMLRRSDFISFQAVMTWYTNLLCVAPAGNGVLYRKTG